MMPASLALRQQLAPALLLGIVVSLASTSCAERTADGICEAAAQVVADPTIPADARVPEWARRAHDSTQDPRFRSIIENIASMGRFDREIVELSISDVVGKPWTCPALDQLILADTPEG